MATWNDAGRVAPKTRGAYDASTTYEELDIVSYNSIGFICRKDSLNNTPDMSGGITEFWQPLSNRSAIVITDLEWSEIQTLLS